MPHFDPLQLLEKARELGCNTVETVVVESPKQALDAVSKLGFPVVMKLLSKEIVHKTEAGAVITDIYTNTGILDAYARLKELQKSFGGSIVIQKQVHGVQVFVGIKEFPIGTAVLFGQGGIFVEAYRDISARILPVSREDIAEMIEDTIIGRILMKGYRGKKYCTDKLIENIYRLCRLYEELSLKELDANPIIVGEKDCWIVDIRGVV